LIKTRNLNRKENQETDYSVLFRARDSDADLNVMLRGFSNGTALHEITDQNNTSHKYRLQIVPCTHVVAINLMVFVKLILSNNIKHNRVMAVL